MEIVFLVLSAVFMINYFMVPLGADQQSMMSFPHLAFHQYGGGIGGIMNSWDMKPFGFRIIYSLLYRTATCFADFWNKPAFEFALKLSYFLFFAGISAFVARRLSLVFGVRMKSAFFFLTAVFLASSFVTSLQAEEIAALLAVLAVGLLVGGGTFSFALAGFVAAYVIYIKFVTAALSVFVFFIAAYLLWCGLATWKKFLVFCMSGIISALLIALLVYCFFPGEVNNVHITRELQHGARFDFTPRVLWSMFRSHTLIFRGSLADHAFYVGGAALSMLALALTAAMKKPVEAGLILVSYVLCLAPVVAQNRAFGYHFMTVLPAFLTGAWFYFRLVGQLGVPDLRRLRLLYGGIIILLIAYPHLPRLVRIFLVVVGPMGVMMAIMDLLSRLGGWNVLRALRRAIIAAAVIWVGFGVLLYAMFFSPLGKYYPDSIVRRYLPFKWYYSYGEYSKTVEQQKQAALCARSIIESKHEKILYIQFGGPSYFLGNPSHSIFFSSVPLARGWYDVPLFNKTLNEVLEYNGRYIVSDTWVDIDRIAELRRMLASGYKKHDCGIWTVYSRYFHLPNRVKNVR